MERAGFFPRSAAALVDLLIFAIGAHLAMVLDVWANGTFRTNDFGTISGIGAVAILVGFAFLEVVPGATPGKAVMGLVIASSDEQPATRAILLRRALAKYAGFLLLVFPAYLFAMTGPYGNFQRLPGYTLLGLQVIATIDAVIAGIAVIVIAAGCFRVLRADGRAMHDLAAGTAVFHKRPLHHPRGFAPVLPMTSDEEREAGRVL